MEGNDWWATAVTPDGVHLWQVGYSDVDTAEEVDALMASILQQVGMPENWVEDPGPWALGLAPGRPEQYFLAVEHEDGTPGWLPREGVTVHTDAPHLTPPEG